MLTRPERLTSREFDAAFSSSRTFRDGLLSLRVHWRSPSSEIDLRAAFVVPKKLGKAAWRNRTRRRVQEAFRLQRAALQVLAGRAGACDCIFLAQAGAHGVDFEVLQRSVESLLARAAEERLRQRGRGSSSSGSAGSMGSTGSTGSTATRSEARASAARD